MKKIMLILIDALILFALSTVVVCLADKGFSGLKGKSVKDDPLVTAIAQNNLESLKAIIEPGADATHQSDSHGRTALMRAAYANLNGAELTRETDAKRAVMIPLLVGHGAALNEQDHDGWSALMWAAWSGLAEVTGNLLEAGASHTLADHQGNTALIIAAQRGNAAIVRSLLAKGADKSVTNKSGNTALDAAVSGSRQYPEKQAAYSEVISALR